MFVTKSSSEMSQMSDVVVWSGQDLDIAFHNAISGELMGIRTINAAYAHHCICKPAGIPIDSV